MNELEKLGNTYLKLPKGLKKNIYHSVLKVINRGYVNTLEIWHNKLLMRTFAFKWESKKYKDIHIQEVCRRLENARYVLLCNIENRSMSGNVVYWTDTGRWEKNSSKTTFYNWYYGNKNNWWFDGAYDMFDVDETIIKLGIKYCGYNSEKYMKCKDKIRFFKYYELYTKYPKIELLAKSGLGHLVTGARYFNFKGKSFEQIFKIKPYWKKYIRSINISEILEIRRNPEIDSMKKLMKYRLHNFDNYPYIKKYFKFRMFDYIEDDKFNYHNHADWSMYNDYLKMAEESGMPLNENKYLYPKNLKIAHDDVLRNLEVIRSKEYDEGVAATSKKYKKYNYQNNKYFIRTAKSSDELVDESIDMHNCVRTYIEAIAKGKTCVLFLRKVSDPSKSFVTVELRNKTIIQAFAYNNSQIDCDTRTFLKEWQNKFKLKSV